MKEIRISKKEIENPSFKINYWIKSSCSDPIKKIIKKNPSEKGITVLDYHMDFERTIYGNEFTYTEWNLFIFKNEDEFTNFYLDKYGVELDL